MLNVPNRVQDSSKTITWTYQSGDPTPISITIINSDDTLLNGVYSVDEYVDVSTQVSCAPDAFFFFRALGSHTRPTQTYTITNVTLKVGAGYKVQFVRPTNASDILATSASFEVKASGSEFFPRFEFGMYVIEPPPPPSSACQYQCWWRFGRLRLRISQQQHRDQQ